MIKQSFRDITQKINSMDLDIQAATDGKRLHILKRDGVVHMYGANPPLFKNQISLDSCITVSQTHATFITELTHHMQVVAYLAKIGAPI